nr:MAG TPA: hypothetical protein [Caudoviricetes sp.]
MKKIDKIEVYNYINCKIKWLKIDFKGLIFIEISIKNRFIKSTPFDTQKNKNSVII